MKPDPDEHASTNEGSNTYSRRRFSMNSGLNLSPVTYSADGEDKVEDPSGLRTKPMFIRKRWDDACRKVDFEVIS
jgi:hypothetical protein